MIVDDEPEILQSLLGLLRREFLLFTATSGEAALAILIEHPIHVIMTDQRLPMEFPIYEISRKPASNCSFSLKKLAGHIASDHHESLLAGLSRLVAELRESTRWESAPTKNR